MDAHVLALAIARAEGFDVEGSIPQRANNPGDLRIGDRGLGMLGEGITIFPTVEDGWDALDHQCGRILSGKSPYYRPQMTLAEMGMTYSGGDQDWAKNVAAILGVPESITLAELAAS